MRTAAILIMSSISALTLASVPAASARSPAEIFKQTTGCRWPTSGPDCPMVVKDADGGEMCYAWSSVDGQAKPSGTDKWAPVTSCHSAKNCSLDEACCALQECKPGQGAPGQKFCPDPYCPVFVRAMMQAQGRYPRYDDWQEAAGAPLSPAAARSKLCAKGNEVFTQRAYRDALERQPTEAEVAYWKPRNACYDEVLAANRAWLSSPAGAQERRGMIERGYRASFGREPTQAELDYWMAQLTKAPAPFRCSGDTVDTGAELTCANLEWLYSAAGLQERRAIVRRALDRWCHSQNGSVTEQWKWNGSDADLDGWAKSVSTNRWTVEQVEQQLAVGVTGSLAAGCKNVTHYNTGALTDPVMLRR